MGRASCGGESPKVVGGQVEDGSGEGRGGGPRKKVLSRKKGKNPEDTTYRAKQGKGSIQYSKKAYKIKFGFY